MGLQLFCYILEYLRDTQDTPLLEHVHQTLRPRLLSEARFYELAELAELLKDPLPAAPEPKTFEYKYQQLYMKEWSGSLDFEPCHAGGWELVLPHFLGPQHIIALFRRPML